MSTDVATVPRDTEVSLFSGATPDAIINVAADVATKFADIVKRQQLYQRIGQRDHVLIEGWQTVGALVGVFAVKDGGVVELPWPELGPLGERPEDPGREPPRSAPTWPTWDGARAALARWEHHRALIDARSEGLAFGYKASFQAVNRAGQVVGWAEGHCDRTERSKVGIDNYALKSWPQTRGQSRALAAGLRFIVKLAGYATTPAEDMPDVVESKREAAPVPTLDLTAQEQVSKSLEAAWPMYDSVKFVTALERRFPEGIPEPVGVALRAWAWFCEQADNRTDAAPDAGAGAATDTETTGASS